MENNERNQIALESIIKIEPEELQDSNENKTRWTSSDEILRKKAEIFSDPVVLLDKLHKRSKTPSVVIRNIEYKLARKGNVGLGCKDPHTCYICSQVFANRDALARHLRDFHAKAASKFCDQCPKSYLNLGTLRGHMETHMKKHLACNVCDFRTAAKGILKAHKLTHVRNEKCKICDKQVTSLRMHMISHAPKEICPICDKRITKYSLKAHLKTHDNHKCKQCDQNFTNHEDLRRHNLRSHHKGEIFECHCGSVFKNTLLLYTHKLNHKNEKVACSICNKSYVYEAGFRRHWKEQHFKTHGPVRKKAPEIHRSNITLNHGRTHICDKCGSKYSNRSCFRNHINMMHLHPKTYFCDLCPKVFKFRSALPVHMHVHLNLRPYVCDICGYRANAKCILKAHILKQTCRSECKICHERVTNMALHNKNFHFKAKCPTCGKVMKKSSLAQHIKLVCQPKKRFKKKFDH